MSAKHGFNQAEVLMLGHTGKQKGEMWNRFESIADEFEFSVRVTGDNFRTHEINCDEADFNAVLELTKGV